MSDLMRIGSSAMNAAYAQLQTTGQNIANAATPGYVRREVTLRESGSLSTDGFRGSGVDVEGVRRIYDAFLVRESASTRASAAQDGARADALRQLDGLFSDPAAGIGAAFDDLVTALADLTAKPSDPSVRTAVLARVEAFASRAAGLDSQLVAQRDAAYGRMQGEVDRANDALAALADVNRRLGAARGSVGAPNGLLDERDRLLGELNEVLRATATIAEDGTASVSTARGEALVVGASAARLQLVPGRLDPLRADVAIVRGNGSSTRLSASELGGRLAGLDRFAGEDVASARGRLGQITAAVATRFNDLQARGLDATGSAGQPLFALGTPAASGAAGNAGTARIGVRIAEGAALAPSDYVLAWDGLEYTATRLSDDSVTRFATLPRTIDGLELQLDAGAPAAGDRVLVRAASAFASGARALQSDPARLATALPVAAEAGSGNGGDLRAASLDVTAIGPATGQPVTVTFTAAGTFDVSGTGTGNPTGLAYTPGMQLSYNGWTLRLEGIPAAGDTLRIVPTANPATDNRNARAMQALGDATMVDGATVIARYADLVGDVGTRTQSATVSGDMSRRLHADAERARTALSSVNLDEEAARLLQFQQAYQAAAKVIAAADEMFRTLLAAIR